MAAVCVIAPGAASASAGSVDRAATHAYLADLYAYEQVALTDAPASKAALEAAVSRLGSECAGVLAGAPQESSFGPPMEEPKRSARQRGEAKREQAQLSDLRSETSRVISAALQGPRRVAALVFAGQLRSLHWHDPAFTQFMRYDANSIEEQFRRETPDACADMKAWVASGYKTLSPASKALVERSEAERAQLFRLFAKQPSSNPLLRSDAPGEKALIHKTIQLASQVRKATGWTLAVRTQLDMTLGLASHEKELESLRNSATHSVKVGGGRTAAGSKYTISVEIGHGGHDGFESECKLSVEISEGQGSSSTCVSSSGAHPEAKVACDEGLLTIESETLPATRRVRLSLSNGAEITSRPIIVPKRLGGPVGIYYQAVRGPSPIPVALDEIGARGKLLRVVKLPRLVECTAHPVKYLPGGLRTLVHGHTPSGTQFSIVAERYRLYGHVHFELTLNTGFEVEAGNRAEERFGNGLFGGVFPGEGSSRSRRGPFEQELSTGCHPYEYAILYGLLSKPRDTVLVKIAGRLQPLKRVRIPASLHVTGVLVYAALGSVPEQLIVRSPSGKTVQSKNLRGEARETRETCEGESEGPAGPSVGRDDGGSVISVGG